MKITQWLGYNEDSSQYLLRRGELRALVNLQPRRAGMLITRHGMGKIFGAYSEEPIYGIYRKDTPFTEADEYFIFQKIVVPRTLTQAQADAGETPFETVWAVSRLSGQPYQSFVISQQPLSPNGLTLLNNMSVSEDRHGRVFIFFGHGAKPIMYRPSATPEVAVTMGLEAPPMKPSVVPAGNGYFVERVEVVSNGGSYWGPPTITASGGSPDRAAQVKAIVQSGLLVGAEVLDGGSNYQTPPSLVISSDKIGAGFRGVGILENDPGVQGFVNTTAGTTSLQGSMGPTDLYGTSSELTGNKIMYLSSPVTATTTCTVGNTAASGVNMVVASVAGVSVGDFVTVYPIPVLGMQNENSLHRVVAINMSTNTVTMNKAWTSQQNTVYTVQFRANTTLAYAPAIFSPSTNKFTASLPLRTFRGAGHSATATLTFSAKPDGYGLGVFSMSGYTVPTGGVSPSAFAWKNYGWNNYLIKGPNYWNGHSSIKANSSENSQYAGLQASSSTLAHGFSGTTTTSRSYRGTTSRRSDVYFPNYDKISVWVCTGTFHNSSGQWVRREFEVKGGATPYIEVTLQPAVKRRNSARSRGGRSSLKDVPYETRPGYRPPVVRINLRHCPDSWIQNDSTGMNRNTATKEKKQEDRLPWWNATAKTPRPIVDFAGVTDRSTSALQEAPYIDYSTVEVIDAGTGWEQDTTFALRIYQANPYDQTTRYNTGNAAPVVKGSHKPYGTDRFAEFVFRATTPTSTVAGPPQAIAGPQYVTETGINYRSGDIAGVTLCRRDRNSAEKVLVASYTGYISTRGESTECTYAASSFTNASYTQTGNLISISFAAHGFTEGDLLTLTFGSGPGISGTYRVHDVPGNFTIVIVSPKSASGSGLVSCTTTRQLGGAAIIISSTAAFGNLLNTRYTVECATPGVLLPFSQIIAIDKVNSTITIDKMADPDPSAKDSFTGIVDGATNTSNPATTKIVTSSTNSYIRVGQQFRDHGSPALLVGIQTVLAVQDNGDGTKTMTVTGNVLSTTYGTTTFLPRYTFNFYSGVKEATTIEWTASQIATGDANTKRVTGIRILSGGSNYHSPPLLLSRGGGTGYGLSCSANVSGGVVTGVTITDPGKDYTAAPEVYADSSPADAKAVMRPALRGTYRCAYRYADRSETVVRTANVTTVFEDEMTIRLEGGADGIEAGMLLESDLVPRGTAVTGVSGGRISISQKCGGAGLITTAVVESGGYGYGQGEVPTVAVDGVATSGFAATATMQLGSDGTYYVAGVTVTNGGSLSVPVGKHSLRIAGPAYGGAPATGYAFCTTLNTSLARSVTFRDFSKPVSYSDFSPIVDVDCGPNGELDHASELKWSLTGVTPPERADLVEFYRTSADQSLVFYRLDIYGVPTESGIDIIGRDTLTDEELFDTDRANYGAMPVVLPNGNLNAYRFGIPRTDMSVCVAFQDRLWYGVSTSGKYANTLFYSEFDEFESCPDTNELPIQNNQRATDSLTALVPFGSMLLAMQHNHTYALTYNTDPSLDSSVQMISHRGCLNQRCWDIHDNLLYAVDENGVYAMSKAGELKTISLPVREFFTSELIDLSSREQFFLTVCPKSRILRFFCSLTSQPTPTPSMALCYHIDQGSWWTEKYPNSMASAVIGRPRIGKNNCAVFGAADGNIYELIGDYDSATGGMLSVEILNPGDGYETAPTITCPGGYGVQLQGIVSEGRLVDALVHAPGWGLKNGFHFLAEDGTELATEAGSLLVTEEPAPIPLDVSAPSEGGTQAEAYGVFTDLYKTIRFCSVVDGSNVLSLIPQSVESLDFVDSERLATQYGSTEEWLVTESGEELRLETTPIEVGMEVYSECLPLGVVVTKILGNEVFVAYETGEPVTSTLTASSVQVTFIKKYRSHIPFRLATGHMQLVNETNVVKNGDALVDRSITVLYTPTKTDKYLELVEYYNASDTPRANVMRRNRGGPGGFVHRQDSASTVLNVGSDSSALGAATGVAKATFGSQTFADMTGADRHVRVELHSRIAGANEPADLLPQEFVLHTVTIDGVIEDAE
jgi:hypothetical protein